MLYIVRWLPLLFKIFRCKGIAIIYIPVGDVINFKINLNFSSKPFFLHDQKVNFFYEKLHTVIFSIPAQNFSHNLGISMHVLERFLMISHHKLLADTHITKTSMITTNDFLACVKTVNLYLLFIINHMK